MLFRINIMNHDLGKNLDDKYLTNFNLCPGGVPLIPLYNNMHYLQYDVFCIYTYYIVK